MNVSKASFKNCFTFDFNNVRIKKKILKKVFKKIYIYKNIFSYIK